MNITQTITTSRVISAMLAGVAIALLTACASPATTTTSSTVETVEVSPAIVETVPSTAEARYLDRMRNEWPGQADYRPSDKELLEVGKAACGAVKNPATGFVDQNDPRTILLIDIVTSTICPR